MSINKLTNVSLPLESGFTPLQMRRTNFNSSKYESGKISLSGLSKEKTLDSPFAVFCIQQLICILAHRPARNFTGTFTDDAGDTHPLESVVPVLLDRRQQKRASFTIEKTVTNNLSCLIDAFCFG